VKAIAVPSDFPKERGGEKTHVARRGSRSVEWYVFLETGIPNKPRGGVVGLNKFSVLEEVEAAIGGTARD
jgi:hypothetical protein